MRLVPDEDGLQFTVTRHSDPFRVYQRIRMASITNGSWLYLNNFLPIYSLVPPLFFRIPYKWIKLVLGNVFGIKNLGRVLLGQGINSWVEMKIPTFLVVLQPTFFFSQPFFLKFGKLYGLFHRYFHTPLP